VSVMGEAGLGKSRLIYEFKQKLLQEGERIKDKGERNEGPDEKSDFLSPFAFRLSPLVEGSCFTYGEVISYFPILEVVKALVGLKGAESESEARDRIAEYLAELNLEASAIAPYVHNLLSLKVEDEVFPKLTEQLIRQRTVEALRTLILAEAQQQPLVMILEDVHWIDKASEEVLTAVVEVMEGSPLMEDRVGEITEYDQ
ncbi:MAG: AAA family ATPase, partial [Nitrospira sp.]|nr:AAA family ATPase [Nitrospira sp.]